MKIVSYKEVENILREYIKKWPYMVVVEEIKNLEAINYYLENVIENNRISAEDIHNLRIFRVKDYDVYYYHIRKDGLSNNIILTKDEKKIVSAETKSTSTSKVKNSITTFCTYENDNYEPKSKFVIHKLDLGDVVVNKIILMDRKVIKLPRKRNVYDRKEFKFYTKDDEILCMKKEKDDYYIYEPETNTIVTESVKLIEDKSQEIINILDNTLGNKKKVKEYSIKRSEKRVITRIN